MNNPIYAVGIMAKITKGKRSELNRTDVMKNIITTISPKSQYWLLLFCCQLQNIDCCSDSIVYPNGNLCWYFSIVSCRIREPITLEPI